MADKRYKIENDAIPFEEGKFQPEIDSSNGTVYEPIQGQRINVLLWVRYPSYDFIFGVPDKDSPKYEKEISFIQYRDTRLKTVKMGMYLDIVETKEFIEGLSKCLEFSKEHLPHLWKKYDQKT